MCQGVCVTERDRQTDTQTHRQTDRQTDTQTDRQTHTDTQTDRERKIRQRERTQVLIKWTIHAADAREMTPQTKPKMFSC